MARLKGPPNNDKMLDSKLASLERRLDKDTAHIRQYNRDMKDIQLLLHNDRIDKGEAHILAEEATKVRNEAAKKLRKAKGLRSHPAYPLPPRPTPNVSWFKRVFGA